MGLLAGEICCFVRVAGSLVLRRLRVRTYRASLIDGAAGAVRRED